MFLMNIQLLTCCFPNIHVLMLNIFHPFAILFPSFILNLTFQKIFSREGIKAFIFIRNDRLLYPYQNICA